MIIALLQLMDPWRMSLLQKGLKKTFSYVQYKAVATNYSVSEGKGKPNSLF